MKKILCITQNLATVTCQMCFDSTDGFLDLKGPVQDRAFAGVHVIKEKHLTIRYSEHEAISFRSAEQNKRISIIVMLIVVVDSI